MIVALVVAGAVVGLGVALVLRELVPAPPDLGAALARLNAPPAVDGDQNARPAPGPGVRGWLGRWLRQSADGVGLPVPRRDLNLLGRTVEEFLATKIGLAALGLVVAPVLAGVFAVADLSVPVTVPAAVSAGLAVLFFLLPDVEVKQNARAARREFRRGLCSYVDLVALERLADAGAVEALERSAALGGGWVFTRIRDTLLHAQLVGTPPWQALNDLAVEVGVTELGDVGDIVAASGEDGAAVHHTLRAHAKALRTALLTEHETTANAASERLAIPVACLGLLFVALLTYPALARILMT